MVVARGGNAAPRGEHFEVFAVDLRGQGRSTRTPGRYTLDNMGNDLVRFIDLVIGRPAVVSGLSSGGLLSAWLSAFAKPRQPFPDEPPQNMKEYDPEWGRALRTGSVATSCDHAATLQNVKAPVLLTHHLRLVGDAGHLLGAMADSQAARVPQGLEGAGVAVDYRSFPAVGHAMHSEQPDLFADTLLDRVETLGRRDRRRSGSGPWEATEQLLL